MEKHNKAEKILKEEIHPGVETNIKIAKLQLLKGLWTSKFSFERSTDELLDAFHQFDEIYGTDRNYFGANCYLEIGSNYLRQNEVQTATAFLFKANEILEELFTDSHPLMSKYYSYSSEVASHVENNEMMLQMAQKQLDLTEKNNQPTDEKPSLFILDPIVSLLSIQSQAKVDPKDLQKNIDRVELILFENGIADGT